MSTLEHHYSASGIETRILEGLRAAGLDPDKRLTPAELGALDHFHTGGMRATRELLEMVKATTDKRVLDIGAGLGGAARLLSGETGCQVDCLEMSGDFCAGARLLNRLTGLEDKITVHQGSALALPFADNTFDLVMMQNVGMNIADKAGLYSEIRRVLKPGGLYAFQEMAAGDVPVHGYPLPWATEPEDNCLITPEAMVSELTAVGLETVMFEDTSEEHLNRAASNATPSTGGQLGLSVFVDNLSEKATNARISLENGAVRLVRGIFTASS